MIKNPRLTKKIFRPPKKFFSSKKPKNGKSPKKGGFWTLFDPPPKKVKKGGLFPVSCRFLTKGWDYRFLKGGGGWGYFRSILRGGGSKRGVKKGGFLDPFLDFFETPKNRKILEYTHQKIFSRTKIFWWDHRVRKIILIRVKRF